MKLAKTISILGMLAMTAVLIYGFTVGDFFSEGSKLFAMPWGIVSLVDLYTGFTLFSAWIIYREKSLPVAIVWTVAMMTMVSSLAVFMPSLLCNPATVTGANSGWASTRKTLFAHSGAKPPNERSG